MQPVRESCRSSLEQGQDVIERSLDRLRLKVGQDKLVFAIFIACWCFCLPSLQSKIAENPGHIGQGLAGAAIVEDSVAIGGYQPVQRMANDEEREIVSRVDLVPHIQVAVGAQFIPDPEFEE